MTTNIEFKKGILFVRLNGSFYNETLNVFESRVIPVILGMSLKRVNIDLKDVNFVDKSGIDSIIKISNVVSRYDGKVVISGINDKVYKTYSLEREYTKEYYKYLDGYIKDEDTLKKYYRFLLNDYIIVDSKGNIVKDGNCYKETCYIKYLDYKEEIENPKTGDNIYKYLTSTSILIVLLILIINIFISKVQHLIVIIK